MADILQVRSWDSTVPFFRDPYRYISRTCRRLGTDAFQTRIGFAKTVCMYGRDAAQLIYKSPHLTRRNAAPRRVKWTLFGEGGVQGMDGHAHHHRKGMFLSLMTEEKITLLSETVEEVWQQSIIGRRGNGTYLLYDQLQDVLARAACRWAGVIVPEDQFSSFRRELTALFDLAGTIGPTYWWSLLARQKANRRMMNYIQEVRDHIHDIPPDCAASVIAGHRDLEGNRLTTRIAAVELLNVLRPIVAVSAYLTHVAHALVEFPECREELAAGDDAYEHAFAQEVRRFYPFFPAVPARVAEPFTWRGYSFEPGTRLLLDIYGTNHDERHWSDPEVFQPERFQAREAGPYELIAQGGGDHATNHRCPGEWITIDLIKLAARFLTRKVRYGVPKQDLAIDFRRMPALPKSRFAVAKMRLA